MKKINTRGFTLVELLVVISIIAILAAVVMLIMNPIEMRRRSNDAVRLTDMANLRQAIEVAAQESTATGTEILCVGGLTNGVCEGNSNTGTRAVDGTGWIKVILSSQQSVSLPTLPIDPVNDATYKYSYKSDGTVWEINAVLESTQQASKMTTDGGGNDDAYEVGSSLTLIP